MAADNNLLFIREKIYEIKSAVMYTLSNDVMKLPNNIVSVVKVDDEGNLWFVCNPPMRAMDPSECVFPARLHFYRKGKYFHIEVSGKATVINNEFQENQTVDKPLLIKMNMANVEYTVVNEKKPRNRVEMFFGETYRWLLRTIAISRPERSVLSKLT